ncbi:uncharacterized protein LOC112509779 isoform X1 [Cynara cardunculus var. scolymus]|uniref:uncharacterized protein LOC112509779 isoform X1 n=1 Tax=Cynara cardunculus var. scolymus TaxID=59895 RepID=UPI000D626EFF|nr:uncharacterized protein LOC112509779 isoform X1 [Cynara cardunculus var. scolymus]
MADDHFSYLIVHAENGRITDLLRYGMFGNKASGAKFLQSSHPHIIQEELLSLGGLGQEAGETPDHRWVIVVSILMRKLIKIFGKPMEWTGYVVDFILNLLSLNGNLLGLFANLLLAGKVVIPRRGSATFISTIGHIDGRIDLDPGDVFVAEKDVSKLGERVDAGNKSLMDLCMMASKLAYENANVIKNVVNLHWKMDFVDFYDCWNDYQKERSTQVFIFCDKQKDANLIVVSFRGTEPFDADDWITDFDYSWYDIPKLGKLHMGFLEALGLGNRSNPSSFQQILQAKNGFDEKETQRFPEMVEMTAYFAVRSKLKSLLKEHTNAKFMVTGHSLGGALAILFPTVLVLHEEEEVLERLLGVHTFGQPRVGNRQLGRYMESRLEEPIPKYYRVVYCNDIVPRLPYDNKTFLYKHFGVCLYYNSFFVGQKVEEEPNRNYYGLWYLIPEYVNAVWELMRGLGMGRRYGAEYKESWEGIMMRIMGLVIPGVSAHAPPNYINSIRLGKLRHIQMSTL